MSQIHRLPLSVIVPAGNRKDVIEDCLKSVRWADELIVVESFSTDGTLEVIKKYADRVLCHDYGFSALQKNWAIPQATHEWVMIVDTDERVPAELREEIIAVLSSTEVEKYAGFRIPRMNYFLGEPLRHTGYYPDYQIRLFRRDVGRYSLRRVHAHVLLEGPCCTLQSPLIHYAHRSVNQALQNLLVLMTTWEAEERTQKLNKDGKSTTRHLWFDLTFRPLAAFFLRYFWQGGWRDGYRGLITSLIWSMYVRITYMKMWEANLDLPSDWWISDWANKFEGRIISK